MNGPIPEYCSRTCRTAGASARWYNKPENHEQNKARQRQRYQEKTQYVLTKLGGKCIGCGYDRHACAIELHHLDPTKKKFARSGIAFRSYKAIDEEIKNCVLLCSNCHKELHQGLRSI